MKNVGFTMTSLSNNTGDLTFLTGDFPDHPCTWFTSCRAHYVDFSEIVSLLAGCRFLPLDRKAAMSSASVPPSVDISHF